VLESFRGKSYLQQKAINFMKTTTKSVYPACTAIVLACFALVPGTRAEAPGLVTVEGSVNKPGQYPVVGRTSLIRIVAIAGGTSDLASLREAIVFRTVGGQRLVARYNIRDIRGARAADPEIFGNDLVVIGDSAGRKLFKDILSVAPLAGVFYPLTK
jgi:hypothetical protein